jgi:hypothetical protein
MFLKIGQENYQPAILLTDVRKGMLFKCRSAKSHVSVLWIAVDKVSLSYFNQFVKLIFPHIHSPNSNRTLNKKGIIIKYYKRY